MTAKVNWDPTSRQMREFGLVMWAGFGLIGWLALHRGHAAGAHWIWGIAGAVGALALIWPWAARPFYWLWMGIGAAIGAVTSRIVMALIFFGVLTPIALWFRWRGRDVLCLKRPEGLDSYWNPHPEIPKDHYRHLF